ncbi:MAG TPA: PKD domain-containing protein, partial [Nocardioidaceae bacterium]|nr:PKD domain-containing protein [Nocardioidaceae bacterium]
YVSDDSKRDVHEVVAGGDGRFGTGDDTVTSFDTAAFGNTDPEGLDYDTATNSVWVVDGIDKEVFRYRPGSDGRFGTADDIRSRFDIGKYGAGDPEGLAYDGVRDTIAVIDSNSQTIYELDKAGALLNTIDISAAGMRAAAGLTLAPSTSGSVRSYYAVARGVDNDSNPNENDGRLYELKVDLGGGGTPQNTPPVVSAGPDQTVVLPGTASLSGSVQDDGLPVPPGDVTSTWTQASGPAGVTFADSASPTTTATFPAQGTYVLRLTANDGAATSADELTVTVLPAGSDSGTQVVETRVLAGSDDVEQRLSGWATLVSSDLELTTDGANQQVVGLRFAGLQVPQGATVTRAYLQFRTDEVSTGASALTVKAEAGDNAATYTNTSGNVTARPTTSAGVAWTPPDWLVVGESSAPQRTPDLSSLIRAVVSRPGWAKGNALALQVSGTGRRTAEAFEGGASTAPLLHVEYSTDGGGGPGNAAPTVNAGADQSVTLPSAAVLDATVSDDGPSSALTYSWTQVSGEGTTTFSAPSAEDTSATFSAAGTYVLRLTASDGELTGSDQVTVTVAPSTGGGSNTAPVVNAGPDQSVTLPASATLNATVTDDGLPGTGLSYVWTQVSGPGVATFSPSNAEDTSVSFSAGGSYVLRLTASDGQLSGADQVTVTVSPASGGGGSQTVEVRLAAGSDDAEQRLTGSTSLTSSDLELTTDGTTQQVVGLRFVGLQIPQGATVTNAYVQFRTNEVSTGAVSLTLKAEAADNAATYSATSGNVTSRATTTASVAWSPPDWSSKGEAGAAQRTPNLAALVQAVVSRAGWAPGNALALQVSGTGRRTADAYEYGASFAPLLHIEYTTG